MEKMRCYSQVTLLVCVFLRKSGFACRACNGLSDICIMRRQNMWTVMKRFDWNRLAAAELERHYAHNGRDNQSRIVMS